ncbi:MAG: helix-turn-helix domain-containing protein [Candidatus Thorarchaeota archaeon]|nr:helix-turn-helix domain-containing protein [Candidatus Thorarchaeota archaeon]
MNKKMYTDSACIKPLVSVLRLLGRQWTISLILLLGEQEDTVRYSNIRENLNEESNDIISDSTLSRKLSELANLGIIYRKSYDEVPPRVEYGLTEAGMTLFRTLNQIADWTREQCHTGMLRIPKKDSITG